MCLTPFILHQFMLASLHLSREGTLCPLHTFCHHIATVYMHPPRFLNALTARSFPSMQLYGMLLLLNIITPHPSYAAANCVPMAQLTPPTANTTDPTRPFYIDTSGLSGETGMPQRDPLNPLYPHATELADGSLPPIDKAGNFILGPTHNLPPQWENVSTSQGRLISFTLSSSPTSGYSPGTERIEPEPCPGGMKNLSYSIPGDPSALIVPGAQPASWTRTVDIYIPPNTPTDHPLPFLIFGDGGDNGIYPGRDLFALVDSLIKEHRIPPMIIIGVGAGGGDAQGSERGREYDTMSGDYADWVEQHILPLVEAKARLHLSHNPDDRATMGFSSSGAAAFAMAWFRPNLYHRVLAYSPSLVNQQWPHDPALPGGGWQLHSPWAGTPHARPPQPGAALIPAAPTAPLHIWYEMGDQDLFYPVRAMPDGMHDWVLAGENLARALAEKGYHYQFIFSRNAQHVDGPTIEQTLPEALEWLWHAYQPHQIAPAITPAGTHILPHHATQKRAAKATPSKTVRHCVPHHCTAAHAPHIMGHKTTHIQPHLLH